VSEHHQLTESQLSSAVPKSYAQFAEDLEVLDFFHQQPGYYVEIGANDGVSGSNTALLEQQGWQSLLVEANPELVAKVKATRPRSIVVHAAIVSPEQVDTIAFYKVVGGEPGIDGLSTTVCTDDFIERITGYGGQIETIRVDALTLDQVFTKHQVPDRFEVLSIDVEGVELEVLKGLSWDRYQPRIIIVEDNSVGADWSVCHYLRRQGYLRVHRTGVNDWYVQPADASRFWRKRIMISLRLLKWWGQRQIRRYRGQAPTKTEYPT